MRYERVLITGAAGFIGSHLADHCVGEGAAVYGIDNLVTGDWANFPVKDANYLEADIADRQEFYRVATLFRPDLIFHCAASYSDPNKWHRDAETNVLGSINAAIVARHNEAKLVYFNTALPPVSSYAISKLAGEQYIRHAVSDALICRLANIYGPRNISGPIPTFYRRLSNGEPCTVVRTVRELVYISDLIDAISLFLTQGLDGTIDICSGEQVAIGEIYETVAEELGNHDSVEEIDPGEDDVAMMELDPYPALERGWVPEVPLAAGIQTTIAWYRAFGVGETYSHLRTR